MREVYALPANKKGNAVLLYTHENTHEIKRKSCVSDAPPNYTSSVGRTCRVDPKATEPKKDPKLAEPHQIKEHTCNRLCSPQIASARVTRQHMKTSVVHAPSLIFTKFIKADIRWWRRPMRRFRLRGRESAISNPSSITVVGW